MVPQAQPRAKHRHIDARGAIAGLSCRGGVLACIAARLAHSNDASHLYKLGLFLPLGKFLGLGPNRVSAGEPLTVRIKQGHLPMMVHSPLVFLE